MRTPFIFVNFKAYPESLGTRAVGLAKLCGAVGEETGRSLAVAPSAFDLALVAKSVRVPGSRNISTPGTGKGDRMDSARRRARRGRGWDDRIRKCRELGIDVWA